MREDKLLPIHICVARRQHEGEQMVEAPISNFGYLCFGEVTLLTITKDPR